MKKVFFILLLLTCIRFFPLLLGKTIVFGDTYALLVPGKLYTAMWLQQGIVPLWNPMILGGISWIGDLNQSFFSLSTLFFVVLPPAIALNLTILTYTFLTALGMYLLANAVTKKSWVSIIAVIVWIYSPLWVSSINNLTILQSACYIPWIIWAMLRVQKRSGVILAAFTALMIFGGYPQYLPYTLLAGLFLQKLFLHGIRWKQLLTGIVLGGALSSVVILPFVETIRASTRSLQTAYQVTSGSLHPVELLTFFSPTLFQSIRDGVRWGPAWGHFSQAFLYGGLLLPLILVLCWRRFNAWMKIVFFGIFAFALFSISGNIGGTLITHIPFFSFSRGTHIPLMIAGVLFALLIAGVLSLQDISKKNLRSAGVFFAIGALAMLLLFVLSTLSFDSLWNSVNILLHGALEKSTFHTALRDQQIILLLSKHLCMSSAFAAIGAIALSIDRKNIFIASLALEFLFAGNSWILYAPNRVYDVQIRREIPASRTLLSEGNRPYTGFPPYWEAVAVRAPFSDSFVDSQELESFSRLQSLRVKATPDWNMVMGVKSLTGYSAFIPKSVDRIWNTSGEPSINALPQIAPDNPNLESFVDLPEFRYGDDSLIPDLVVHETPNTQTITFQNTTNQTSLIVADNFDPNWIAAVNGKKVPITNSEGLRKITIEPGENLVLLTYRPRLFYFGAVISLFALLILAGSWSKQTRTSVFETH